MPACEVTLISRPLPKADLLTSLKRIILTFMDKGVLVKKIESLGHKDLPYKLIAPVDRSPVYSTNMILLKTHMSSETKKQILDLARNDADILRMSVVSDSQMEHKPFECNLEDILKPAAERESVKALRDNQKLGHFPRQRIFKRTEKEWRAIPKAYPIAPVRD